MTRLDPARVAWMRAGPTRTLMAVLRADGGEARFVGGAVRNALLGQEVKDVDIATPLAPDAVMRRLAAAGVRVVPTGLEHGTVTAIVGGQPFEVTTLRHDVATDGRHAVVAFTSRWEDDAARRDFTMNALYASEDGEIFDYHGGLDDLAAGRVRFIGDAASRIREDNLRILRLFRFHAWYGRGEIDAASLDAAVAGRAGLARLSGERIAAEILRLLAADNPAPVLHVMARTGILAELIPGIPHLARLEALCAIDAAHFFAPDPVLRLAALLPADAAGSVAERLRLSHRDRMRLGDLAAMAETIIPDLSPLQTRRLLYRLGRDRFRDRVLLHWAENSRASDAVSWRMLLALAEAWQQPPFPLNGRDVIAAGVPEGPRVGQILADLEAWWIDGDFNADVAALRERLKTAADAVKGPAA
jgi:poly(A) polymerase